MQPDEPPTPEEDLEPLEEPRPGDEIAPGLRIQEAAEGEVLPRPVPSRTASGRPRRRRSSGRARFHAFGVGDVLGRSITTWGRHLLPFSLLSLLVFTPLFAYLAWLGLAGRHFAGSTPDGLIQNVAPSLLEWIVTAALIYGVFQHLRNRRPTFTGCISNGLSRLLPVIGVSILKGLCIGLSALPLLVAASVFGSAGGLGSAVAFLLAIAGVVLALIVNCGMWVAVPVCVVERPGVATSMSRSWNLTKGFRWKIFALQLLFFLFQLLVGAVLGGVGGLVVSAELLPLLLIIIQAIVVSLSAVVSAVGYHDLRRAVEGIDTEQLAAVFD